VIRRGRSTEAADVSEIRAIWLGQGVGSTLPPPLLPVLDLSSGRQLVADLSGRSDAGWARDRLPGDCEIVWVDLDTLRREGDDRPVGHQVREPVGADQPAAVDRLAAPRVAALREQLLEPPGRNVLERRLGRLEEQLGEAPIYEGAPLPSRREGSRSGSRSVVLLQSSPSNPCASDSP
jgi:hypothetical protein